MYRKHRERLLKLADVLDDFANVKATLRSNPASKRRPERFSLNTWACGTTACAVGVAGLHPWFRERGLGLVILPGYGFALVEPVYGVDIGWVAVERFFGLTRQDSPYLFSAHEYANGADEKVVAARIRAYVDQHDDQHGEPITLADAMYASAPPLSPERA
jgi:hypothetical protein